MNPLRLSPLPSLRADDQSRSLLMEREGFVDEAVVLALMTSPLPIRSVAHLEDLALSSDDQDFAGWRLSPALQIGTESAPAVPRRATPPFIAEPGIGAPHLGGHRWWLAGLAGVLSTLLFSVLLLNLSSRPGSNFETIVSRGMLSSAKPVPVEKVDSPKIAPELTEVSPLQPRHGSDD